MGSHSLLEFNTKMQILLLLLFFSSLEYVRSEGGPDFPALPFRYSADLQYNIISKERFIRGKCAFNGKGCDISRQVFEEEYYNDFLFVFVSIYQINNVQQEQEHFKEVTVYRSSRILWDPC